MNIHLHNYDQHLSHACRNLPAEALHPQPSSLWPQENIELYDHYRAWLLEGGSGRLTVSATLMPIVGHIFGLNLNPYPQWDLEKAIDKVLTVVQARGVSQDRFWAYKIAIMKFRKFVKQQLGIQEAPKFKPFHIEKYTTGLPAWLVSALQRHERSQERNWRPQRVLVNMRGFWRKQGKIWQFLCQKQGVVELQDLKRANILAFIDSLLDEKYALNTVNFYILSLRAFLVFLQQEGYSIPQALLQVKTLKTPDRLPKYLNEDEIIRLRDVIRAKTESREVNFGQHRLALLDQALFYILWHGGLRLGEVEDLRMEDLDLPGRRLMVREGKGRKDRTIYLTNVALHALQEYLEVRGAGESDHVFLFHHAHLNPSFVWSRLKTLGEKVQVRVYSHQLRHTCATQLLNAGCRITSIHKILGHKNINTTLIYAKAYDQTVAEDFYAAMQRVEQRLDIISVPKEEPEKDVETQSEVVKVQERQRLLAWVDLLSLPELPQAERLSIVSEMRRELEGEVLQLRVSAAMPVLEEASP